MDWGDASPSAQSKSVFRTSARILVQVSDVNPMAIADSGASHVILPMTALCDDKSANQVNLRLVAGEIAAVEVHRRSLLSTLLYQCPLGRMICNLQLTAIWTPKSLTLSCVGKSGTAHGLMQCPIYTLFHSKSVLDVAKCLQMQRKGQKTFPPQLWKQLYLSAITESSDLCMANKAVDTKHQVAGATRYVQMQLPSLKFSCCQDFVWTKLTSK